MILALLQLRKGRMNFGARSFLSPRTGFLKTATRSELDVSGARSPTKMLYSFANGAIEYALLPNPDVTGEMTVPVAASKDTPGTSLAQLRANVLDELGIWTDGAFELPLVDICARAAAAWAGEGKVRKQ
jgi:hypothetical protein